jgi:hypothetical protein
VSKYDEEESPLDGRTFTCKRCGEQCQARFVDNGIGPYEYWGAAGRHSQIDIESICCGSSVEEQ